MNARNFYRSPIAVAVALTLADIAFPAMALAGAEVADVEIASNDADARGRHTLKLSPEGAQAYRAMRAARIAIHAGNAPVARDMLAVASSSLTAAGRHAPVRVHNIQFDAKGTLVADAISVDAPDFIAIDGRVVLPDGFVATPEQQAHLDNANEHLATQSAAHAMDELRRTEANARFTRVLMPLQATTRSVAEAARLLDAQAYQEARRVLEAAEAGLRTHTVRIG